MKHVARHNGCIPSLEYTCAVWHGPGDVRIERQSLPPVAPHEVLIKVALCGVCGTDLHTIDGEYPIYPPPRVIGHEYSGTVLRVGPSVTRVRAGERVAVEPSLACAACFDCREGQPLMCANRVLYHGGFGELVVVDERVVFPIPDSVSLEAAALTEPLSCCLHALSQAGIRQGDRVAILGCGLVGLLLVQLARRAGASRVIASDPVAIRRAEAVRLGTDVAVDPSSEDVMAASRDLTGGVGVDIAFEAVGVRQTVLDAIALPRRGGTAVIVGVAPTTLEVTVRPFDLFQRELTLKGSYVRANEFRRAVEMLPLLELESLISDVFPLAQTSAALAHVRTRSGIKTAIRP